MNLSAILKAIKGAEAPGFTGRMHGQFSGGEGGYERFMANRELPNIKSSQWDQAEPRQWDSSPDGFLERRMNEDVGFEPAGYPPGADELNGAGIPLREAERQAFDERFIGEPSFRMDDMPDGPEEEAMRQAILGVGGVTIKDGYIEIPNANIREPIDPGLGLARQIQMLIRGQLDM